MMQIPLQVVVASMRNTLKPFVTLNQVIASQNPASDYLFLSC